MDRALKSHYSFNKKICQHFPKKERTLSLLKPNAAVTDVEPWTDNLIYMQKNWNWNFRRSRYFHITLQPLSEDDALGGFLLLISGHPDGHEQGSHQGDLKVLVIKNMMRVRMIMEMMMMMMMMMMVMVVVTEQLHLPEPVLKSGAFARARIWLPHQHAEHSDLMLKMHLP